MASTLELWLLAQMNQRPQLISKQVLAASVSSVTFSSIPQQFTNLRLTISAQSDGTGTNGYDSAVLRFNGVSSASYNWNSIFATQGGAATGASATAASSAQCAEIWNAHFASAGRGLVTINIPNYSDTNNLKGFHSLSNASDGGTASIMQWYSGCLGGGLTTAISSVSVLMNTGNFVADSTFCLYGE